MTTTLNEIELAARWGMSPKTLQRWRTLNVGPEYLKLGKKIMYPLTDVEDYENLVRSNFAGTEEILLYLRHAGEASLEEIQAACLGGKQ
ncbi:helix-turn-helix transcriptional regulator, partial [Limnohabitans sp.]|uniref:helix-turn-helix transcriptional regulator n=1 Tax=Limnohabitans sp. TaxID=1907725 RepID=UPI00391BD836